jgi:hypothetical protein
MKSLIPNALFAASIALAVPSAAHAALLTGPAAAPIAVSNVQVAPNEGDGYGPGFVDYTFKNTSNMTATKVVFELNADGSYLKTVADVGTFAPGVTIKRAVLDPSPSADQQVGVKEVTFSDGSVWTNTAPLEPVSRRQSSY